MERKNVSQTWITDAIAQTGMSKAVIAYLGAGTKTSVAKDLSWSEILLIWQLKKKAFEKTDFYKKLMKPYRSMKKEHEFRSVREIIATYPASRTLFLQELPVKFALLLCVSMAEYRVQFIRSKDEFEKKSILTLAAKLTTSPGFSLQDIAQYQTMAKGSKKYTLASDVMINMFVAANPYEGLQLALVSRFTIAQLSGLCNKIDEDTEEQVFTMGEILRLFEAYPQRPVVKSIINRYEKTTDKKAWTEHLFGLMGAQLVYKDAKRQRKSNWNFYPILKTIFPSVQITPATAKTILQFLPQYGSYNGIDRMLDIVAGMYTSHPEAMGFEHFTAWYSYCPKRAVTWLPLYKKMIQHSWKENFGGVIEAYRLSGDTEILRIVIADQLPKLQYPNEAFIAFFKWLLVAKKDLYQDLYDRIVQVKYLAKWWRNLCDKGASEDKARFVELASHFS